MTARYTPNMKNIYIVGAQCTGKTTLVHALESSFGNYFNIPPPKIVKEVARSVLKVHGFTANDITSDRGRCSQLQSLILEAQSHSERAALKESGWMISDRSGLDPIVYASRHVGPEAVESMMATSHWQEAWDRMSKSLIFVCEAGANWLVDDGVRLMPRDMQDWIDYHHEFCQMLEEVGLKYHVIPCSMLNVEKRAAFVWSKWMDSVFSEI